MFLRLVWFPFPTKLTLRFHWIFDVNVKIAPILNKIEVPVKMEHRNWHHSRAIEINLNIIIDNTLVRNKRALKTFFYWEYSTAQVVFQNPPPNRWGWFFSPPRIFLIPHTNSHRDGFLVHRVSAEFPPQNHPLTCRTRRWAKVYHGELAMKDKWRQTDWQLRIFPSLHGEEIGTFILLTHHSADLLLNKYRNIST